jgi:hypothetical protein
LPNCDETEEPCECDPEFFEQIAAGVLCVISGNTVTFTPAGHFNPLCDKVQWVFFHDNSVVTTYGNESITHTFPGPGEYDVCMIVYRTTATGEICKEKFTKQVTIFPPGAPPGLFPNPVSNEFLLQLRQNHTEIRVIVYDMAGKVLIDQKTAGEAGQILRFHTESFTKGLYTAKIITLEGQWVFRFIKME